MQTIVGVRFKKAGKIYYFDPGPLALQKEEPVIVETARGIEYGHVVIAPREIDEASVVAPLKPVLRLATEKDTAKVAENASKEAEALRVCEQKIIAHKLDMNLVSVEYTFDVSKIIFFVIVKIEIIIDSISCTFFPILLYLPIFRFETQ